MDTFLNKLITGDFSIGSEEKKIVMDKTISASSNPSDETIKVDHLDTDNSLEKDILEQRKAERDVTGTVPLPLFRFEDKQKKELIEVIKQVAEVASDELKNNIGGPYTPLFGYIDVLKNKDIDHLVDLTISRNKELFNTSAKEFEIEVITCYIDKKLRVRFNITEDKLIDEKIDVEYSSAKRTIKRALDKLIDSINERINLKKTGTEKDIKIYLAESSGDENYGTGFSIFVKYEKLIDYSNYRRGKEDYKFDVNIFDESFTKSLEDDKNYTVNEEQISIDHSKSTEAIADGMSENSEDQDNGEEDTEDQEITDDMQDINEDSDDSFDGSEGDIEDEEEKSNDSDSGQTSDKKPKEEKISGRNPYADINSKNKVSIEFKELKNQIDKVLLKLGQFKSNVVVKKLIELDSNVEDALKNSYSVPIHDSLIRYSLYVTQFEDLISELEKYFELQSKSQNTN